MAARCTRTCPIDLRSPDLSLVVKAKITPFGLPMFLNISLKTSNCNFKASLVASSQARSHGIAISTVRKFGHSARDRQMIFQRKKQSTRSIDRLRLLKDIFLIESVGLGALLTVPSRMKKGMSLYILSGSVSMPKALASYPYERLYGFGKTLSARGEESHIDRSPNSICRPVLWKMKHRT